MNKLKGNVYEITEGEFLEEYKKEMGYWEAFTDKLAKIGQHYGFRGEALNYYDPSNFGFLADSEEAEKYDKDLLCKSDSYNIRRFKKTSKIYKELQQEFVNNPNIQAMEQLNQHLLRTGLHIVGGENNVKGVHRIKHRLFIEIRSVPKMMEQGEPHNLTAYSYEDYLALLEDN